MTQSRLLARGLLVSFLLLALLAAPGALTFTWAGAAVVQKARTNTPIATGTATETSTGAPSYAVKFAGLHAAPLAACSGSIAAQWKFDDNSIMPTTGTGTLSFQPGITGPTFPLGPGGVGDPSIAFTNWPTASSLDPARYLEFDVSTQGRNSISLSLDYMSDTNGPTKLDVYYSTTGGANYYGIASMTLVPSTGWLPDPHLLILMSPPVSELDDNINARFRLYPYAASTSSGTLSLDNITVSGTCIPPAPVTISGNAVLENVTLSYNDVGPQTATSGAGGAYSFTVPSGWSGDVTPTKAGYTFAPDHITYTNVTTNQTGQNYAPKVTISGNAGVGGATMAFTGGTSVTAAADGTYSLTVPYNFSGTVTPSKTNYVFTPASTNYSTTPVTSNLTNQNYAAAASCTASPLQVLINEVGWGATLASSSDDWLELHNTNAGCSVNLDGWSLVGVSNSGVTQFNIIFSSASGDVIGPDGYFVIVRNNATFPNVPQGKIASTLNLVDSGEILYLYGPSPTHVLVDTANLHGSTSSTVGAVGPWPAGVGAGRASMERYRTIPDASDSWVTFAGPIDPSGRPLDRNNNVVHGTPGLANWAAGVLITPSPVPPKIRKPTGIPPTPFAHMVINEFLPRAGTDWNRDGAVNVYDEFIEIKNLGPIDLANLAGWKLDDAANPAHSFTLPSMKLKAGERYVFYRSTTNIPLEDSGGTVRLLNPGGVVFDARSYGPVSAPDVSRCRIPDGRDWYDTCFPTPGNENSLTRAAAALPPIAAVVPPPCLLPDTVPEAFRRGECAPYGSDIWSRTYWDDQAGNRPFLVQDVYAKWKTFVR